MPLIAGSADVPSASCRRREVLTKRQRIRYRFIFSRFALNADESRTPAGLPRRGARPFALPVNRPSDLKLNQYPRAGVECSFSDDAYQDSQIVFTNHNGAHSAFRAELPSNIFNA